MLSEGYGTPGASFVMSPARSRTAAGKSRRTRRSNRCMMSGFDFAAPMRMYVPGPPGGGLVERLAPRLERVRGLRRPEPVQAGPPVGPGFQRQADTAPPGCCPQSRFPSTPMPSSFTGCRQSWRWPPARSARGTRRSRLAIGPMPGRRRPRLGRPVLARVSRTLPEAAVGMIDHPVNESAWASMGSVIGDNILVEHICLPRVSITTDNPACTGSGRRRPRTCSSRGTRRSTSRPPGRPGTHTDWWGESESPHHAAIGTACPPRFSAALRSGE